MTHPLAMLPDHPEDFEGLYCDAPPPAVRIDEVNWHVPFSFAPVHDWTLLAPGETGWFGPVPDRWDYMRRYIAGFPFPREHAGVQAATFLAVPVGRFLRVRRLAHGQSYKLQDWLQLTPGESHMLTPEPNDDDEEKSVGRARYLQSKGRGGFKVFTASDGSLWVTRRS